MTGREETGVGNGDSGDDDQRPEPPAGGPPPPVPRDPLYEDRSRPQPPLPSG